MTWSKPSGLISSCWLFCCALLAGGPVAPLAWGGYPTPPDGFMLELLFKLLAAGTLLDKLIIDPKA